jgi:hypothetical protein
MKKFLLIGLIIGLVLVLVGGGGVVYARVTGSNNNVVVSVKTQQNGNKNAIPFGPGGRLGDNFDRNGPGMMNPYGYGPGGMLRGPGFGLNQDEGLLHDYLVSAFAKAVNLTADQVNTRLANGETLRQIAVAQGFTGDQLTQLATQVVTDAINQAVTAGVITQAQADKLLQQMQNHPGFGFGPGFGFRNCPGMNDEAGQPTY